MSSLHFRSAESQDLQTIIELLASDELGATREQLEATEAHSKAFEAVSNDPNHTLLIAELGGQVAGVLQLSFLPGLTYQGRWRAQVEGVRVAASMRGKGIGKAMMDEVIRRARERDCCMIQLTTDRRRPRALSFYERLGFVSSHVGMKLHLG